MSTEKARLTLRKLCFGLAVKRGWCTIYSSHHTVEKAIIIIMQEFYDWLPKIEIKQKES